jgi:4'-phosphopantetheinyl transferase
MTALVSIAWIDAELRSTDLATLVPAAAAALHRSVSHTAGLSVVTWADVRVGVDVERPRPRAHLDRLIARTMRDDERAEVTEAADRDVAFAQHWTRVEAYLKAIGTGVAGGYLTRPGPGWIVIDLDLVAGWVGAVAVDDPAPVLSVRRLARPGTSG